MKLIQQDLQYSTDTAHQTHFGYKWFSAQGLSIFTHEHSSLGNYNFYVGDKLKEKTKCL